MTVLKTDSDTDLVVTTPVKCGCSCQKDINKLREDGHTHLNSLVSLEDRLEIAAREMHDLDLFLIDLENSIATTDRSVASLVETTSELDSFMIETERDVADLEKENSDILDKLAEIQNKQDEMLIKLNKIFPSIFSEDSP